ncbi:hypothetical protein PFISCL1PPCAC_13372, partial [Pristionchus fissidentatus]
SSSSSSSSLPPLRLRDCCRHSNRHSHLHQNLLSRRRQPLQHSSPRSSSWALAFSSPSSSVHKSFCFYKTRTRAPASPKDGHPPKTGVDGGLERRAGLLCQDSFPFGVSAGIGWEHRDRTRTGNPPWCVVEHQDASSLPLHHSLSLAYRAES